MSTKVIDRLEHQYLDRYISRQKRTSIIKVNTSCCALCQLSMQNFETKENIENYLDELREEAKGWHDVGSFHHGQRAVFTIITPAEGRLEDILVELGFTMIQKFKRRVGYPEGLLKMYFLNL